MRLLVFGEPHLEFVVRATRPRSVDCDAGERAVDIHRHGRNSKHWAKKRSAVGGKRAILMLGVLDTPNGSWSALLPGKLDQARPECEGEQ
ncbi:hypothetical protein [Rhizobacter sp. OV335]|uniref:hypothetical protein n=1 Tax=Rhizobacter sp. OV335 TaxID=1500264 RepID=UPI00091E0EF7|nr:hypothetical protein [Rhizobacter sp. OV335]SHN13603.1 hypothetical protein SAMN02787076_03534 [Rhizobacter sp. OV335]